MPAPALAPIAWKAAQIGAVAAVTWYVRRRQRDAGPRDVWRERTLDETPEGVETDFARDDGEARAGVSGRFRRTIRLGADGPGVEIDFAALARLRARRV